MKLITILFLLLIGFMSNAQSGQASSIANQVNPERSAQFTKIMNWIAENDCQQGYMTYLSKTNHFSKEEIVHIADRKSAELRHQIGTYLYSHSWNQAGLEKVYQKNLKDLMTKVSALTSTELHYLKKLIVTEMAKKKFEALNGHGGHKHENDKDIIKPGPAPGPGPDFGDQPEDIGDQCTNPDFESCNFGSWDMYIGSVSTANGPFSFNLPFQTTVFGTMSTLISNVNEHNIVTGGTDPNSGQPMVFPGGGSCTALLGDGDSGGADASRIVQTFLVDQFSTNMTLNYHVILEDPNHSIAQQPYFRIRVTDSSGNLINCASYEAYSGDGQPGWTPYGPNLLYPQGYHLPWTSVLLPLGAYVNQNITVEVTVGDCTLSGHCGYAYVDFSCVPLQFNIQGTAPCYGPYSLWVPPGAVSYQWSNGDTTSAVVLPDTGYYSVSIIPITGPACAFTVDTLITGWPPFTTPATLSDTFVCLGDPVVVYTDTSDAGFEHTWTLPDGSVVVANSIPITSVGPADAGFYYLLTTDTISGCIATDSIELFLDLGPTVTATDFTICQEDTVNISALGGLTYSWNNGLGAGDNHDVNPMTTTDYEVYGYSASGCPGLDTATVTVLPIPQLTISPDTAICIGFSAQINASGANTYAWDNGLTGTAGPHTVSPIVTTTYTLTGTLLNGCINDTSMTVTVYNLPIVDAGPDQTVCETTSTTLAGSGAVTYVWDNGIFDNVSFTQAPSVVTYTVVGTDINGCVNTDSAVVTVNANPIVDGGLDITVCENTPITLTASGADTYAWDNGAVDGVTFTQSPSVVLYTVVGTDLNNCIATDQVLVTVNANPIVNAGADQLICENNSFVLNASGALTYVWTPNIANGSSVTPTASGVYVVVGTDANGCQNMDSMAITYEPLPIVDFTADTLYGCDPLTVNFTNNTPGTFANCDWTFGDGNTGVNCGLMQHTYSQPGTFDVTLQLTSINGCVASQTQLGYIYVEAVPTALFSYSPTSILSIDPIVEFDNQSINATQYTWDFDDGSPLSTVQNPTHTFPLLAGDYYLVTLTATSPLGCIDQISKLIEVKDELLYYVPNAFTPDDDEFNGIFKPVISSGIERADFLFTIYNRWGEVVFQSADWDTGWDGFYNGKKAPNGVYTWKIEFLRKYSDERVISTGHVNLMR